MAKSSLFQKVSVNIKITKLKIFDITAPITSLLALIIYKNFWATNVAKKIIKKEKPAKRKEYWNNIHQPENWWKALFLAFTIIFLPQLLVYLWLTSPFCSKTSGYGWSNSYSASILGTGWQVMAGLIGITFVIVIFVVEFANRDKYEQRAFPIFFAETRMLFTASFGILVIFSAGITSLLLSEFSLRTDYLTFSYYWQWFLYGFNTLLILNIFIRTVLILPRSRFITKLKNYNHRIAKELVEIELIERMVLNKTNQFFKDLGIKFPFFEPDYTPEKIVVALQNLPYQIQSVTDINFKLVELAYRHAKFIQQKFSDSDFIFYAKIGHRIAREKPGIALINPVLNRPCVTSYLERCIQLKTHKEAKKSQLAEELIINRDMILHAVNNQESNTFEYLMNHYRDLIEAFLKYTDSYGIHFSQETASKALSPFSDWKMVSTIIDQYRSLISSVLNSTDFELVLNFLKFPVELMNLAILYRDHLIYQQFAWMYSVIYYKSREIQNTKLKESVIDCIKHLLIDHRRFTIEPRLKFIKYDKQLLSEFKPYFIDLLSTWNRLIKGSLDNRLEKHFSDFSSEVDRLIRCFYPDIDETSLEMLEFRFENLMGNPQQENLTKQLLFERQVLQDKSELKNLKNIMFLGFGGWITHLLEKGRISIDDYLKFIPSVHNFFMDITQLYQDYTNNLGIERGTNIFNWDSWEMSEWPEVYGEVSSGTLTYSNWLLKYFLVRSIEIVPYNSNQLPKVSPTNHSKEIYNSIVKMSEDIKNSEIWIKVFRQSGIDKLNERINAFIEIAFEAKTQQEFYEEQDTIDSQLETTLVESFKSDVINSWQNAAVIRNLVSKLGEFRSIYSEEKQKEQLFFGYNELIPKGGFIKQNRISYVGWGENYGLGLATFEDTTLALQFKSGINSTLDHNNFSDSIMKQFKEMIELGLSPIIFYNGLDVHKEFYHSDKFNPEWHLQNNPLDNVQVEGLFNQIPIIRLEVPNNTIHLVDLSQFGVLTQYKHQNDESLPILIQIDSISYEQAQEIIDKNPDQWRKNPESGEIEDQEKSIRRILQNVKLHISEYCVFEEINPKAHRSFSFIVNSEKHMNKIDE